MSVNLLAPGAGIQSRKAAGTPGRLLPRPVLTGKQFKNCGRKSLLTASVAAVEL